MNARPMVLVAVLAIFILLLLVSLVARIEGDGYHPPVLSTRMSTTERWPEIPPAAFSQAPSTTTVATARTAPSKRVHALSAARPVGVLQDIIRQGFARFGPDVAEQAVRVAGCESTGDETGQRLNERAVNGQHAGLLQLSRHYHEARARRLGFTWAQMTAAEPNVTVAADIYAESGWGPWTCRWAA